MLTNVPQFIDVEDKIVGPLTGKQLGWLASGGVIFLVLWNYLDTQALILAGIVDFGLFGALAFYRPYGRSLVSFVTSSIIFVFRPKVYIWRRLVEKTSATSKSKAKVASTGERKKRDIEKIKEISEMLKIQKK